MQSQTILLYKVITALEVGITLVEITLKVFNGAISTIDFKFF